MAPNVKESNTTAERDITYQRSSDQVVKKKTFMHRINFEKTLPLKKRLIPNEILRLTSPAKSSFKPTYERPMTRSQGRRSVGGNSSNKENQATVSTNNTKKRPRAQSSTGRRSAKKPRTDNTKKEKTTVAKEANTTVVEEAPKTVVEAATPTITDNSDAANPIAKNAERGTDISTMNSFGIDKTDELLSAVYLLI